MDTQERRLSLLKIRNASEHLLRLTQPRRAAEATVVNFTCSNFAIPVLDVPFPNNLVVALRSLGLSDDGYSKAHRTVQEWVQNLQNLHITKFQQACRNLASLPHFQNHAFLVSSIEHLRLAYQKAFSGYISLIVEHVLSAQSNRTSLCNNAKIPFNNEYTPLLELYFEKNAYPSLPDRKLLARKSMMSMRQIEVWFQNHRARARKEGKTVTKPNGQFQPQSNFESLKDCVPFISATDSTMKTSIDNELKDDGSSEDEALITPAPFSPCSFSSVAPPHAFPTTYPPNLTTDPFPNENGRFTFPPPIWMRTLTQTKVQTAVHDMDEFISIFASKLHLRDGSRRKCDVQNAKRQRKLGFNPTLVVPAPAPHPALIRAPGFHSSSGTISSSLNSSVSSNSSFTSPVSSPQNPHKSRKFAPFSKRTPSTLPANHTSHRLDAFSVFATRTCSLSSIVSSQSRSSSSSSVSSAEPETPPLSPTHHEQNPLFAEHDYQLLDELFGPEPSQLFDNMPYATPDFLFPTMSLKDISHNPLYDLSSMFPPAVAQVHC